MLRKESLNADIIIYHRWAAMFAKETVDPPHYKSITYDEARWKIQTLTNH